MEEEEPLETKWDSAVGRSLVSMGLAFEKPADLKFRIS